VQTAGDINATTSATLQVCVCSLRRSCQSFKIGRRVSCRAQRDGNGSTRANTQFCLRVSRDELATIEMDYALLTARNINFIPYRINDAKVVLPLLPLNPAAVQSEVSNLLCVAFGRNYR